MICGWIYRVHLDQSGSCVISQLLDCLCWLPLATANTPTSKTWRAWQVVK